MMHRIALALTLALVLAIPAMAQDTPVVRFTVERFVVSGENPLPPDASAAILTPFTGDHQGLAGLQSAADALQRAIAAAGHPFRTVVLPPQRLSDGTVTLQVVAVGVGQITVEGNEHFSSANILAALPELREGEPPDTRALARNLRLTNENPSKTVAVVFKESETAAAVDARVTVQDRRPWQVFSALNNTGSDETGDWRVSFGAQHANLFDSDHALTLSYTTAPEQPGDVQQYGAFYRAPIYEWNGALSLFYTRADVSVPEVPGFADRFTANGAGHFSGARYAQFLPGHGSWSQTLTFGLDNKLFKNDLSLLGTLLNINKVRSTPVSVQYSAFYDGSDLTANARLEYARNMELGSYNERLEYFAARPGASRSWDAVRAGGSLSFPFTGGFLQNWTGHVVFDSQWANEAMIPGEQFGIGGLASVRGFDEREVTGDNGARFTFELYTPPLAYGARLLGFLDGGFVSRKAPVPSVFNNEQIASVGVGLRWQWQDNVSLGVDLANVINGSPLRGAGTKKVHFNLFARF